jgi:hypothetical protein
MARTLDWDRANTEVKALEPGTEPWNSDFLPDRTLVAVGKRTPEERAHLIHNTRREPVRSTSQGRRTFS